MSSMSSWRRLCGRKWCRKCGTGGWAASEGFMVGDKTKQNNNKTRQDSVELEASLAPAKADVGAEAKADQKLNLG